MNDGGSFISPQQFYQRLKQAGSPVCLQTVYNWCAGGRLDARKIARRWRIRESEVRRVLETGC